MAQIRNPEIYTYLDSASRTINPCLHKEFHTNDMKLVRTWIKETINFYKAYCETGRIVLIDIYGNREEIEF